MSLMRIPLLSGRLVERWAARLAFGHVCGLAGGFL
jgi:hypothetical protein